MAADLPEISIPADLLPADGRFGCGPSKIRPEQVEALAKAGVQPRALAHITGDGFLNIRRIEAPIGFEIDFLPPAPPISS